MNLARYLPLVVLVPTAFAQCDPGWDAFPGTTGVGKGYAQPIAAWDDGTGEAMFVGGSFDKIGGLTIKGLARWDPDTGLYSKPGTGLSFGSTNGFLTSIQPFEVGGESLLVVGGFFASAGGVDDTQSLAAWDGTDWRSLGAGFVAPQAVWSLEVGDLGGGELLYLAGGFLEIAGQPASGVASWDGTTLTVLGDGLGMTGFSPFVNETVIWDDGSGVAMYAVGRFDSIDDVSSQLAARYRPGSGWEKIGTGLFKQSSTTTLDAAVLYDDGTGEALYIAGSPFRSSTGSNRSVYKWDGTDWTSVGQDVGGRVTDLRVWDDGTGDALYMSGTATPGINYLARLEAGVWEIYLDGVGGSAIPPSNWPSVFGLGEFRGDLVVCGNFTEVGGDALGANGVAFVSTCADDCLADFNGDGTVNTQDVIAFLGAWTALDGSADIDGNGIIDTRDVIAFLGLWVVGC